VIHFLGFDQDAVTFELEGEPALRLARELGAACGFEPCARTKAVVSVTLHHEDLTRENCTANLHEPSADASDQCDLWRCERT